MKSCEEFNFCGFYWMIPMCAVLAHSKFCHQWARSDEMKPRVSFLPFLFSLGFSLYIFKMGLLAYILSRTRYNNDESNTDQLMEFFFFLC